MRPPWTLLPQPSWGSFKSQCPFLPPGRPGGCWVTLAPVASVGEGGESPLGTLPCSVPKSPGQVPPAEEPGPEPQEGSGARLDRETGPGFAWGRGGLTGARAKALAALRVRQLGISSGPRHRKAGGLELSALWPERTRVPGTCSLAGWSRHVGQLPRRRCCEAALAAQSASTPPRPGPRSPAGAAVITGRAPGSVRGRGRGWGPGAAPSRPGDESTSGAPGPPQSEAAKRPSLASSPRLAPWPPSGSIGRAGLEAASSHLPGELGPGQQRFPAASSLALSGMTSSGSHSGKELQSPWEWEWRGAFQGPSWQPLVPDQGRHHASGCLPAGQPLGGQLAFVSFSG